MIIFPSDFFKKTFFGPLTVRPMTVNGATRRRRFQASNFFFSETGQVNKSSYSSPELKAKSVGDRPSFRVSLTKTGCNAEDNPSEMSIIAPTLTREER